MIEANEQCKQLRAESLLKDSLIAAYASGMKGSNNLVTSQQTLYLLQSEKLAAFDKIISGKEKYIALKEDEIKAYKKALRRSKTKTILTGFSALAVAIGISLIR